MGLEFKNKGTYVEVTGYEQGISERRLLKSVIESFYHRLEMEASAVEVDGQNIFLGDDYSRPAFTVRMNANGLVIDVNGSQAQGLLRRVCD